MDATAIPDKSAETVLQKFIEFVCTHGVVEELITDQGREFCNRMNELFCEKMGITHKVVSLYHPQTCDQTERFNRTLCGMLVHFVSDKSDDWDTKLPYLLFAFRMSVHTTTEQTPFFLVFGR